MSGLIKKYCASAAMLFLCGFANAALIDEMLEDALSKIPASLESVPANLQRVAVYSIEPDKAGQINTANLQDQLISVLLESRRFAVIDRQSLKYLIEEQKLSQTGLVETSEMVQIGKVVGVQGFFFGSVEIGDNQLVLSLKLVDVESSAIVYSRNFTGQAASASRMGYGFASVSGIYTNSFRHLMFDSHTEDKKEIESKDFDELSASSLGILFSYKQGSKALKWAQTGVDVLFSVQGVHKHSPTGTADLGGAVGVEETSYGVNYSLTAIVLKITPKFYFSLKHLLGWSGVVTPYAGAGIHIITFQEKIGGWWNSGSPNDYDELTQGEMLFSVTPVLGAEFNLSKSISLFAETSLYSKSLIGDRSEAYFAKNHHVDSKPGTGKGMAATAGLKYYWR